MSIEQLKAVPLKQPPQPKTPRCEADVNSLTEFNKNWREGRYEKGSTGSVFQCSRPSIVKIGGKCYCRLHGGHLALDMFIAGKLVEAK